MTRLAEFCILSHGWHRFGLLVAAGALTGLAMPPFFWLPLLFVGLPIWVWCLDGAETAPGWGRLFGPAFRIGFAFGLGYFLTAIHWVGGAFFVDGGLWLAVMPFAILALAAILALFWAFASALAHLFWSDHWRRIVALAAALTLAEFARGHLFTGFPFDLLGYALTANGQMMQLASIIGIYGLTFLAALLALTPALIWPADDRPLTTRLLPLFAALAVLAAQIGWGQYRLDTTALTLDETMRLRLVQPNIAQADKWQAGNGDFTLDRLISISETKTGPDNAGLLSVTHLVWPESALPFYLSDNPEALARIARMLPDGTTLLTGMPRLGDPADPQSKAYNSVMAINTDGEIVQSYDKTHLVPFGEYLPFGDLLAKIGIRQFVPGNEGWAPGDSRRLLTAGGMPPALPLICYEILFSGDLGPVKDAAFILNLTNDGWFDGTIGPGQHFHHARVRAAEEGRAMVRVANTGISGIIDPLGHVAARLTKAEMGVLDAQISRPLPTTLFAQYRHWPLLGVLVLVFAWLAGTALRQRNRTRDL